MAPVDLLLAYTLPGPEFFQQFAALLLWAGAALVSALLYPIYSVVRWMRGSKPEAEEEAGPDEPQQG